MTTNKTNRTNNLNHIPSWVTLTLITLSGLTLSASVILTSGCSTIRTTVKFGGVEYRLEKEGCRNQLPQPSTTRHIDSGKNTNSQSVIRN